MDGARRGQGELDPVREVERLAEVEARLQGTPQLQAGAEEHVLDRLPVDRVVHWHASSPRFGAMGLFVSPQPLDEQSSFRSYQLVGVVAGANPVSQKRKR
jgi:hypothetical protein